MTNRLATWRWLAIALGFALSVLWVLGPALSSSQTLFFRDHFFIFRRLFFQVAESFREGSLPLWDPSTGGGEPLCAYPNALAWHPLQLILQLPGDFHALYDVFVSAILLAGFVSAYALLRTLAMTRPAAFAGAGAFALSGTLSSFNSLIPTLESAAIMPAAIASALFAYRRPSARNSAIFAVCLALHVLGVDPIFFVIDVVLFFALLPHAPRTSLERWTVARGTIHLAIGVLLGASLASIQVLPLIDLLAGTARAKGYGTQSFTYALHPFRTAELFLPGLAGDSLTPRTLFSTDAWNLGRHYLPSIYAGAIVVPVAMANAFIAKRWTIACATAAFCVLALGAYTPIHGWILTAIPPLQSSRYPVKLMAGAAIGFASLWAAGIDDLERAQGYEGWLKKVIVGSLVVLVAGLALLNLDFSPFFDFQPRPGRPGLLAYNLDTEGVSEILSNAGAQAASFAGVCALLGMACVRRRLSSRSMSVLLVVFAFSDLSVAARPLFPVMPSEFTRLPAMANALRDDVSEPVVVRYESRARTLDPVEVTVREIQGLEAGTGATLGIRYVLDVDTNDVRPGYWHDVDKYFRRLNDENRRYDLLRRLGVTHLLVESERMDVPGVAYVGTAPIPFGLPMSAYRLFEPRPFVSWGARLVEVATSSSALDEMSRHPAWPLDAVVIESPELSTIGDALSTRTIHSGRVRSFERERNRITAELDAPTGGLAVIAQRFDEGWRATVDGRDVPVMRVEGMLTAAVVPEGGSRLELEYRPTSFTIGAWLTIVALLVCVCMFLYRRKM